MDISTAKQMAKRGGVVVQDTLEGSDIFGILEYVTADGWAGVRGPKMPGASKGRLDEIQVSRLELDPT